MAAFALGGCYMGMDIQGGVEMTNGKKLFGLCYFPGQDNLIDKHCFGDCGKIIMGAVIDPLAWYLPCREEDCPYEDKRMEHGAINTGETLWLRKLIEVP